MCRLRRQTVPKPWAEDCLAYLRNIKETGWSKVRERVLGGEGSSDKIKNGLLFNSEFDFFITVNEVNIANTFYFT